MLELLKQAEFVVFTTRDFANAGNLSLSAASNRLHRLVEDNFLTRITRGVWANTSHPHFHPLACVPYLLGKEQGYVSFLTALNLHDVIWQIPKTIQVATTGRPRVLDSPVTRFEFLRLKPELMRSGIEWSETHQPYLIATREKALFDVLYISTRKNRRFKKLPELDLIDSGFDRRKFEHLLRDSPLPVRIRSAMQARWQKLIEMSA
jgi:predicted transcriptional regulator of viral defense system